MNSDAFDPNLQFLTTMWVDVKTLTPEEGDRLLMVDVEAGEMVAVFTGGKWVAAHDRSLTVTPSYVSFIPECGWLPVLDHSEYRAVGERLLVDPPNRRRLEAMRERARRSAAFALTMKP